ncbi:hypothetical protein E2E30_00155 [Sphingomonas sp. AAP5]|jgi:hypothetical protein|uniref:hypothetical protein n=1 Tax=Sphingomonas sp. AAP5 TaxID=1523415 RepID=UPI00105728D3|nr:hypothetical protein [Sphingomonas sp. AAP5]QBM74335.1 hypothetical protein E2E30_00155 [Sphingomonas sp. AAP5]
MKSLLTLALFLLAVPSVAAADSGRETLIQTAFVVRDRGAALSQLASVEAAAASALAKTPGDSEALLSRAMATSYRAKLTHSRTEALSAKAQFEALVAKNPRDPEALAALGAWHLSAVKALGAMVARGGLGARKAVGLEVIDRALAAGGDRALFPGIAGMLRLAIDPGDARGMALIGQAVHASAATTIDRLMQRRAAQLELVLKGGDAKLIQALANRLLPLGQFG